MSSVTTLPAPRLIHSLQLGDEWFEERQGGLGRVYFELFQHLPRVGVDFRGLIVGSSRITQKYGGKIEAFAEPGEGLAQRLWKASIRARNAIKTNPVDVIAAHFALYALPAIPAIAEIPIVVHFHGPWAAESQIEKAAWLKYRMQETIERLVYKRARLFIVLSKAFASELIRRYAVPESAVRIVPGGVDTTRFNSRLSRNEARAVLGWPTDRFIILAVRRLAHRMGLEGLINATKALVARKLEVLVVVVGSGTMKEHLLSQINSLGLTAHVKLVGRIPDNILPLAYRASDISVVPSVALEGFGMTTLESLASGTPVMVTPVGGLLEAVQMLSPSLIFDATGWEAVKEGIEEAILGERRLPNEHQCRHYAETNFTWDIVAGRVRKVYAEALGLDHPS